MSINIKKTPNYRKWWGGVGGVEREGGKKGNNSDKLIQDTFSLFCKSSALKALAREVLLASLEESEIQTY